MVQGDLAGSSYYKMRVDRQLRGLEQEDSNAILISGGVAMDGDKEESPAGSAGLSMGFLVLWIGQEKIRRPGPLLMADFVPV